MAHVQSGSNSTAGTVTDVTLGASTTVGNTLVATGGSSTAASTFTSVVLDPTGTPQSFTATFESEGGANDPTLFIYTLANCQAGTIVRLTCSATSHLNVMEFNNHPTTFTQESTTESAVNQAAATASDTGAGITVADVPVMYAAGIAHNGNHGGFTAGSRDIGGVNADAETQTARSGMWCRRVTTGSTNDATSAWATSTEWSSAHLAFEENPAAAAPAGMPPGKVVMPEVPLMAY